MRTIAALAIGLGIGAASVWLSSEPCVCDASEAVEVLDLARDKIARCEHELRANAAALQSAASVCTHSRRGVVTYAGAKR